MTYAAEYQILVTLNVSDFNLEGIELFEVPSGLDAEQTKSVAHYIFTDTLLHAAGFVANLAIGVEEIGICANVELIEVDYHSLNYSDSFKAYCSLLEEKGSILADAIALGSSGKVLGIDSLMQIGMASKMAHLFPGQASLSPYNLSSAIILK